jgi:UDP-N-acetylmuramoyl-tripeptide--D-alanyl-D-alanine ligase
MLELGPQAQMLHHQVGVDAKKIGLNEIYSYGGESSAYLTGFGYSESEQTKHLFSSHEVLADAIALRLKSMSGDVALLLKGSRGMQMEKVLERLLGVL